MKIKFMEKKISPRLVFEEVSIIYVVALIYRLPVRFLPNVDAKSLNMYQRDGMIVGKFEM